MNLGPIAVTTQSRYIMFSVTEYGNEGFIMGHYEYYNSLSLSGRFSLGSVYC